MNTHEETHKHTHKRTAAAAVEGLCVLAAVTLIDEIKQTDP
jgi:hypothetical protein